MNYLNFLPDEILLDIMSYFDNLDDLFNFEELNKYVINNKSYIYLLRIRYPILYKLLKEIEQIDSIIYMSYMYKDLYINVLEGVSELKYRPVNSQKFIDIMYSWVTSINKKLRELTQYSIDNELFQRINFYYNYPKLYPKINKYFTTPEAKEKLLLMLKNVNHEIYDTNYDEIPPITLLSTYIETGQIDKTSIKPLTNYYGSRENKIFIYLDHLDKILEMKMSHIDNIILFLLISDIDYINEVDTPNSLYKNDQRYVRFIFKMFTDDIVYQILLNIRNSINIKELFRLADIWIKIHPKSYKFIMNSEK